MNDGCYLVGALPQHRYVWIDTRFTHREPIGFVPAVWFGLVAVQARAWGCTVLLESGAVYRNLPPHALAFSPQPSALEWSIQDAQTWDCYGSTFSPLVYPYLAELGLKVKANGNEYRGTYLFTVAPAGDAFSLTPEQAKEFTFVELDNGRLTIQPTNHILVVEKSFTDNAELAFPRNLKRQTDTWRAE